MVHIRWVGKVSEPWREPVAEDGEQAEHLDRVGGDRYKLEEVRLLRFVGSIG